MDNFYFFYDIIKNMDKIKTFLKGMAMGAVDIVPGISGGTMALILKIYSKLIYEIKLIDFIFLKEILKGKFKKAFERIDWKFLLSLFLGIITAIISLAGIIDWSLNNYPIYLYSFFFGLIIVSAFLLIPKKMSLKNYLFLILGLIIAIIISTLSPAQSPDTYLFIFLSGALAICAMILPGISGAFILLLLGKYEFMIKALKDINILIISIFLLGCLIGILSFTKFLNYLLKKYYQPTLILLIGFMLGALYKIWPFKENNKNIAPEINQELYIAIIFLILGIIIAYLLGKTGKKTPKP